MPDFRGFSIAVAAAVKPDYADVVARATRRKRRRGYFGAAAIAVVMAGGGGTYALTAGQTPSPVKPAPLTSPGPWRTVVAQDGGRDPQPQPQYTAMKGGGYDITEPDKPLTGLFTSLMAGDLDHLFLEYQDCRSEPCTRMLASTADRGATWRKSPMPAKPTTPTKMKGRYEQPSLAMVRHGLAVASSWFRTEGNFQPDDVPESLYWTSVDGGATWRTAAVRTVDALPAGGLLRQEENGIVAIDPATGDVARLEASSTSRFFGILMEEVPPAAGLWLQEGGALQVSGDGGRTWEQRRLPAGIDTARGSVITGDGRMVYAVDDSKGGKAKIHISADGARTWRAPVVVDTLGPLLSLLPIDERTVLVEGTKDTYRSTDGGQTFTRVGPSLGSRGHAIPGGFIIPTNNNEVSAWLSADGAAWTYVRHPEVP